jgi:hypothetical protein
VKRKTRKGLSRARSLVTCLAICILGSIPWGISSVSAEPYLAIQEGYKCSKCHVNMTGGGKRTDFANIYVQTRLANEFFDWRRFGKKPDDDEKENPVKTDSQNSFFSGRLNEYVAVGGDFRVLLEETRTPGAASKQAFNQRKQNIYLEIDLIPDHVMFYQTLSEGGDAREIFGLVKGEVWEQTYYFKVGQFFLPYGLRLQDDSAFTRAATGFTYGSSDVGAELGFEPGSWAFHVAATNGTGSSLETNRSKRLTASAAYVRKQFRLGSSYATNKDAQGVETVIYGVNGGAQFGRVGVLAEAVVIDDSTVKQPVGILEFNFLLTRGNNLKLSYEYHDPDRNIFENARTRYSLVWEPFLNQFTQVRLGYRDSRGIPQNPGFNSNLYFAELHLFF